VINRFDLSPYRGAEAQTWLIDWGPSTLDALGEARKADLNGAFGRAVQPFIGKEIRPDIVDSARNAIQRVARDYERNHKDIRFTKVEILLQFGNLALTVEIERASIPLKTFRALPESVQNELKPQALTSEARREKDARAKAIIQEGLAYQLSKMDPKIIAKAMENFKEAHDYALRGMSAAPPPVRRTFSREEAFRRLIDGKDLV
jgi:hypothetical protein